MTAMARHYALHFAPGNASVVRSGPGDVAHLGVGRSASEVLRLAGLLFPICPRAHMAASLDAIEHANRITLAPGQRAARDLMLLCEAVCSAIWRAALTWPELLGNVPVPHAVRQAQEASQSMAQGLFVGDWAQPGGAPLACHIEMVHEAIRQLRLVLGNVAPVADIVIDHSSAIRCGQVPTTPLDEALFSPKVVPDVGGFEETPRVLQTRTSGGDTLEQWFAAQARHADHLIDALVEAAAQLQWDDPSAVPETLNGSGIGIAMTARGRLRHALSIDNGIITHWSIAAPTDWNFAPKGPLPNVARQLADISDNPQRDAAWLIAAFDPCAPCTAQWVGD